MTAKEEMRFWQRSSGLLLDGDVDLAINRILRILGQGHRADRAWLIRYNRTFTHFWNTHEWVRAGESEHVTELQGMPVEMGAWLHESLLADRPVHLEDTRKMPRRARLLQAEFRRQKIESLLAVPIFHRGRLLLQIGFDTTRRRERWTDGEVALLRRVGCLFVRRLLMVPRRSVFEEEIEPGRGAVMHLQNSTKHSRVTLEEITHLTAQGDYSRVHLLGGGSDWDARSLKHWASELSGRRFVRVARSVIVNVACIEQLNRSGGVWRLEVRGVGGVIRVGRIYRAGLRQHLNF